MGLTFAAPGALWLLAIVPFVWLALRGSRTTFTPAQQRLQALARSVLLVVLVAALARPVIATRSSRLSVVYAVDVSHSIASPAIAAAADRIDEIQTALAPAHHAIVAFGRVAGPVPDTNALRGIALADPAAESSYERSGSDVESALARARAELAPGHVPRLVLFSDGRETDGRARDAAARLAREGVPVSVVPLDPRDLGDVWVDAISVPRTPAAGTSAVVGVTIGSQRATTVQVEIFDGERRLAEGTLAVEPGTTTWDADVVLTDPGARVLEARLSAPDDVLTTNDRLAREVVVRSPTRVLYVEGAGARAGFLTDALESSGLDVDVRPVADLPDTREEFDQWDVAILSDVRREDVSAASTAALAEWVERDGGGLLFAGGASVFGEGPPGGPPGYRDSEIERLLPVTFERQDEPDVALLIVLDRSWSMAGDVMEICKSAAQAAVDVLSDDQTVGVLTFNDSYDWVVPLGNVGTRRSETREAIQAIEPAGHTLMFPGLEQAYLALRDAPARARHVILLSDGRSYPDDFEGLVGRMADAKITVSSIAVGPAADQELLASVARWGQGRSYVVEDASEVPQIFVQEAENASTPAFDEEATTPVLETRGFLEGLDLSGMPDLRGRTAVVLKDEAMELVATEEGDPLLAFWPVGLGRSAVFASDVKDRWGLNWLNWSGYAPFFTAVVHALERPRPPGLAMDVASGPVRHGSRAMRIALEARDATGAYEELLSPVVRVTPSDGASADVPLRQRAPGRYEATLSAGAGQVLRLDVPDATPPVSRLVLPDPGAEYRFRPPDEVGLRALADATGGVWLPDADALRPSAAATESVRRALWPLLVLVALGLWMVDILLRRIRVFEEI